MEFLALASFSQPFQGSASALPASVCVCVKTHASAEPVYSMSGRRFEWSDSPHVRRFDAWELLAPLDVEMDEAPGWFMDRLSIWPKGEEQDLSCYFKEWCEEPDDVAMYMAAYDEDFGPVGLVYAREVPGHLVFGQVL